MYKVTTETDTYVVPNRKELRFLTDRISYFGQDYKLETEAEIAFEIEGVMPEHCVDSIDIEFELALAGY